MDGDSPGHEPYAPSSNYVATSPDLFSSDDDDTSRYDTVEVPILSPKGKEKVPGNDVVRLSNEGKDSVHQLESARLQRLLSLLQGVPPPPSVTIPQITLNEVLHKLRENSGILVHLDDKNEPVNSLWKPTASLEYVKNAKWPEIKNIIYHDMHFNCCNASEGVEHISMKLHERFIGAETSSWCNTVTSIPTSAKKRQRRSFGNSSPGCRLSHLARRRQTFSSANLAQLSSVAGSGTAGGVPNPGSGARRRLSNGGRAQRCIMVEIKKTDKNKRIKTSSKEALNKVAVSGKVLNSVAETQTSQTTKRALFQSPEEQKSTQSVTSQTAVSSEVSYVQRSKRALWPSEAETVMNGNGKRTLEKNELTGSQRSKMHCSEDHVLHYRASRSLNFSLSQNTGGNAVTNSSSSHSNSSNTSNKYTRRASDQGPSTQDQNLNVQLSELHKRKLFWAITSALRLHGVQRFHPDFPRMASILAFHYIEVRGSMTGAPPASTSEHMLQVVSSKAPEVMKAERTEKSGQEENVGHKKVLKKDERSNKELFRDATASLNVRRSLCVSLSSNCQAQSDKPKQTKRVPSARKSLSFDALDPKTSSGTSSEDRVENGDSKSELEAKGNDLKWRGNGENVPLASAKRVSRSLFLSPKDEVKAAKKDACEQTNTVEDCSGCGRTCDDSDSTNEEKRKGDLSDLNNVDDKIQQTSSEISSVPSISAVSSSTLEADNEASRTSEATNLSEQANSVDTLLSLAPLSSIIPLQGNSYYEKPIVASSSEIHKADSVSSESYDFLPTRVLRETRERAARVSIPQPVKRNRKSLSLSKRDSRSSSSDSVDLGHHNSNFVEGEVASMNSTYEIMNNGCAKDLLRMEPKVVLSPLKLQSPMVSTENNTTSKSTFGSPPFIVDSTLTPAHSPFLGFPCKDDLNSSGEAADESNSIVKVPDGSSEEGNNSQIGNDKVNLEEKVITPLLEAAILESSVCVGSGSSNSTDIDLSFRGRIESLKPSYENDTAINLDLGMNLNVSANLLNIDEIKEKSPVLEKWAERASRSAQKSSIAPEDVTNPVNNDDVAAVSLKAGEHPADESMLPWDESQMDGVSQSSTNMYEKFCSIFDPSSQQGTS